MDPRDTCSGCFGHGPCVDPARHGRRIGPIERELRARNGAPHSASNWITFEAFCVLWDAEISLGVSGPLRFVGKTDTVEAQIQALWPDIYSEAIEAAEALGL